MDIGTGFHAQHLGLGQVVEGDGAGILARVNGALRRSAGSRPRITLTYAQSLDGCIAADVGASTRISSSRSDVLCHELRAVHDAILVGVSTVLIDDPRLTVRHAKGSHPRPVVIDSRLRTPPDANLFGSPCTSPILATTERASEERETRLEGVGATIIRLPSDESGLVNLELLCDRLSGFGIGSLMIEGGARVITNVLRTGLADQLVLTIAPCFLGGVSAVRELGQLEPNRRPRLDTVYCERIEDDLVVYGEFLRTA